MGFEVIYHYYDKKDSGGYNTEKPETFSKKIGKTDELPLEDLAKSVMSQLARRDIMVFDMEIFEFVKRKICHKETKGGIILKNKKFLFDGTIIPESNEEEVVAEQQKASTATEIKDRPLRNEIYEGDNFITSMLAKRNIFLTNKKRYPILRENTVMQRVNREGSIEEIPGLNYTTIDDRGRRVEVNSMHFSPPLAGLSGPNPYEEREGSEGRLSYMGGQLDAKMPVLRR